MVDRKVNGPTEADDLLGDEDYGRPFLAFIGIGAIVVAIALGGSAWLIWYLFV